MRYICIILLAWTIGYILPQFNTVLQAVVGLLFISAVVLCVLYYIHTRITAIRL